jgi:hypothetical protein
MPESGTEAVLFHMRWNPDPGIPGLRVTDFHCESLPFVAALIELIGRGNLSLNDHMYLYLQYIYRIHGAWDCPWGNTITESQPRGMTVNPGKNKMKQSHPHAVH